MRRHLTVCHDVFIGLHKELLATLPGSVAYLLHQRNTACHFSREGHVYFRMADRKWSRERSDVDDLYTYLELVDPTGARHVVIDVCPSEEPDLVPLDAGKWVDNPWKARRVLVPMLDFEEA